MVERWWVAPEFGPLVAAGLDSLDAWVQAAREGRTLSTDRQSAAVLLPRDPPLLLKWRSVRRGRHARTWLRASNERREARAMREALGRGVPTLAPLAVAERRSGGVLLAAALIRPYRTDCTTARDLLADGGAPDLPALLAEALADWHARGFRHGNAYPKNVLVPSDGGPLVPIGFPAARFTRPGAGGDRARWKDAAQMLVGLEEALAGFDGTAWLGRYASKDAEHALRRVAPLAEVVRAKKAARLATRPAREPHGPTPPSPIPPAPGVRRRAGPL